MLWLPFLQCMFFLYKRQRCWGHLGPVWTPCKTTQKIFVFLRFGFSWFGFRFGFLWFLFQWYRFTGYFLGGTEWVGWSSSGHEQKLCVCSWAFFFSILTCKIRNLHITGTQRLGYYVKSFYFCAFPPRAGWMLNGNVKNIW